MNRRKPLELDASHQCAASNVPGETLRKPTVFDPRGDSQEPIRLMAPFGSAENSSGGFDCDIEDIFVPECGDKRTVFESSENLAQLIRARAAAVPDRSSLHRM